MVSASVRLGEELAGLALDFEPRVLVGLGPCVRGDPLHEIEQAGGRIAFFGDHRLDDLRGVGLGEAVLAQEGVAVLVGACDRSEEHTSELQSLMRISYAVFCLKN